MASSNGQRISFFPRVDAAVLQSKHEPPHIRPDAVAPIFDTEYVDKPLVPWSVRVSNSAYPPRVEDYAPASIPDVPQCLSEKYLHPQLTRNERLRLTMLWYYTRGILEDHELLTRLQEKTSLVHETIGWEFVIIGVLDINTYTRLSTFGLPLAILPRRESTCAHTVHQPPGTVFLLPNMAEDWRFQQSPHVEIGGLRSYAGVPLRFETEFTDCVAFGSLCVASNTPQKPLTKSEQVTLAHFADWVVADIIHSARARRQRERRRMTELISAAQRNADEKGEDGIMDILRTTYPNAVIKVQTSKGSQIMIEGRGPILPADLEAGLWEDVDYIEEVIENLNHEELPSKKVVRVIAAQSQNTPVSSFLVVASKEFRLVFDDIDSWFVQTCAGMLSQVWHKRLLQEAMMAKDQFLRGFSHQLRTPIHGILGSVELLAEELKSRRPPSVVSSDIEPREATAAVKATDPFVYINTIKSAGRDLISIVNSMITLNRWAEIAVAERKDALHTIQELESEFFTEIMKTLPGDPRHKPSVFINHELPPTCNSICIDFNLLMHCLLPLALNAIQNTPNGIVMITTSIRLESKELIVDVEDTGCGIHPDHQQRIFEPYEKVDTHSIGAGLGLTLASKFATLLGGSVVLMSSVINQGSHFRAIFGNVAFSTSEDPRQELKMKGYDTPSTFYKMASSFGGISLCDFFTRFLTYNGFSSSRNLNGSLIILDFMPSLEQRRSCFSQVPSDQVAICLVPESEGDADCGDVPRNIICIRGPFLTTTLSAAVEQAGAILSETKASTNFSSQADKLTTTLPHLRIEDESTQESPYLKDVTPAETPTDLKMGTSRLKPVEPATTAVVEDDTVLPIIPALTQSSKPVALLVDDNSINLRIMQMYCNKRRLQYQCAIDGLEAVASFSKHQSSCISTEKDWIELVLMDLQMPVCDGIEATRKIRLLEKHNRWQRCALFIVTGQDSLVDRADAEDAGADEYLVKPVSIDILDRAVKRYFPAFTPS
ncbi:Fc.00g094030.m01.CDS01 [Cosmosporella sp. VM-42]